MDLTLSPHRIGGSFTAIASKSHLQRLLICAALAWEPTRIFGVGSSADIDATMRCLSALGADFSHQGSSLTVYPLQSPKNDRILDCGESGATLRFLLPVVGALGVDVTFRLHGRLAQRPLSPLSEQLMQHGCRLSRPTADTLRCEGRLRGGSFALAGDVSSQFISGLLLAAPLTGEDCNIMLTTPAESVGYIDLTLAVLRQFGIAVRQTENGWFLPCGSFYASKGSASAEGDWSNAAFWLCAGAISAPVSVWGLSPASLQADREIVPILQRFGAEVTRTDDLLRVAPKSLHAIDIDARNIPDLVVPLAAVAACAEGTTHIYGARRLKIKESDRLESVAATLTALGAQAESTEDGLYITGGALRGGTVESYNDHRIAMLTGILSTVCSQPIFLRNAQAVAKSYPTFFEELKQHILL